MNRAFEEYRPGLLFAFYHCLSDEAYRAIRERDDFRNAHVLDDSHSGYMQKHIAKTIHVPHVLNRNQQFQFFGLLL